MPRIYQSRTVRSVLRDQQEQLRKQGSASVLARSGLSVPAEDVTQVDGSLNVVGDLNVSGAAAITGTLSLPAGIIDNDALAEPVIPGVVNLYAENFSLSAAFVERVGVNLTVPSGCTRLLASASAWVSAYNLNTTGGSDGTGADYLYVYCRIGSTSGEYNPTGISGNGGTASSSAGYGQLLSGLTPGATLRVGAWCSSQYTTIAASTYNYVTMTGTLNWLR